MDTQVNVVEMEDGAKLAVFVHSSEDSDWDATPLLCLHGNGGYHGSFRTVAETFSQERPVIVPDMRGQGVSTRGYGRLTYELLAQDALEVLDALEIPMAAVLGYSDGGIEALILARDAADRISGIVTMGANLTPEGVVEDDPGSMEADEELYLSIADELPSALTQAELLRLMIDEPQIDAESLEGISCPAIIMAGEFDIIAPEETELIADSIPDSKLVIVPEAGHGLMRDAPEAVEEELRELFGILEGSED
ncbi:MAG: alpha/beta hydrolase [Atopobiaceae bacterium]|nr:alpha/beta hydrolase [Atopobiaceae bacterium]